MAECVNVVNGVSMGGRKISVTGAVSVTDGVSEDVKWCCGDRCCQCGRWVSVTGVVNDRWSQ